MTTLDKQTNLAYTRIRRYHSIESLRPRSSPDLAACELLFDPLKTILTCHGNNRRGLLINATSISI